MLSAPPPTPPGPRPAADAGLVAVLTAVVVVAVVMPLLAIVVDLGLSRTGNARARSAADAAALAAAVALQQAAATGSLPGDDTSVTTPAHRLVHANTDVDDADWTSCVDASALPHVAGPCVSYDVRARQVRVKTPPRDVPSVFAGVLGSAPPSASATATATWPAGTSGRVRLVASTP